MNYRWLLLAALLPSASLAQTQPSLVGRTYLAKMGKACAETSIGGCWNTFYYRLRSGRDSVAVTWLVQAVCSGSQASTIGTGTTQTQPYAYYRLGQLRQVAITGCRPAALTLTADSPLGHLPPKEGSFPVVFELDARNPRS